jgi:tetratricopeptide (TPR) repeat protein
MNQATLPEDRTEASRRTGRHKTSQKSGHFRAWVAVPVAVAAEICAIALFSCGKSAKDYCNEGLGQWKAGQYELAANSFSEAIRIDPRNPGAYCARGNAYFILGRYRLAIDSMDQGIRMVGLNPKFASVYFWRGRCYHALGDRKKALENYQTAAELGYAAAKAAAQQIVDDQWLESFLKRGFDRANRGTEMEQAAEEGARAAIRQDRMLHGE